MKIDRAIRINLLCIFAMAPGFLSLAQEKKHQVSHVVELPSQWCKYSDSACFITFSEHWIIQPERGSISKQVLNHEPSISTLFPDKSLTINLVRIPDLSYEFEFLEAQLADPAQLKSDLIALIKHRSRSHFVFNLESQLRSVQFHEFWTIDLNSAIISKKVMGITPVIWQRRQSETGEVINDADTGLPVYYKIHLERIDLRNP